MLLKNYTNAFAILKSVAKVVKMGQLVLLFSKENNNIKLLAKVHLCSIEKKESIEKTIKKMPEECLKKNYLNKKN